MEVLQTIENSEYIDNIIFKNINVDFSTLAINKQFKMEVWAKNTDLNAISFEFIVVDGYNVYDADDLSVIDNLNYDNRWTKIKTDALEWSAIIRTLLSFSSSSPYL